MTPIEIAYVCMRPHHMGQTNFDRTETDHNNIVINHTYGRSLRQDIIEDRTVTHQLLLATELDINVIYTSHPTLFVRVIY